MDQFGQNAFAPGMKSSVFVPDQLIAGTLQLVTDTGTITGGVYKRGTVLGMITASGKAQVSICAAWIRNTMMMAKANACSEEPEVCFSWKAWPVQAIS